MSTPDEYTVTDNEGDKLIVVRSQDNVVLGIGLGIGLRIGPRVNDTLTMVTILRPEGRERMAEVLTGELLAGGDASRTHEDRWGTELEIRVDGDVVTVVLRHPNQPLGETYAVELTHEQAAHVHEMMTR